METTGHARIEEVLEAIRPALQADGGDVEFIDFDEAQGLVRLRLMGACCACPISSVTLKQGIERRLMTAVPGVKMVQAVQAV
jgi:Fe-S cluster biogenesis protein NfuA